MVLLWKYVKQHGRTTRPKAEKNEYYKYSENSGLGEVFLFGDDGAGKNKNNKPFSQCVFHASPFSYVVDMITEEEVNGSNLLQAINDYSWFKVNTPSPMEDVSHVKTVDDSFVQGVADAMGAQIEEVKKGVKKTVTKMKDDADNLISKLQDDVWTTLGDLAGQIISGAKRAEEARSAFKEYKDAINFDGLNMKNRNVVNPLYQYSDVTDIRSNPLMPNLGNVYANTYYVNQPVVFIRPGRPKFMGIGAFTLGGNKNEQIRKAILNGLAKDDNLNSNICSETLDTFAAALDVFAGNKANPTKYYDFQPDFQLYQVYTKTLLREIVLKLGLSGVYANAETETADQINTSFFNAANSSTKIKYDDGGMFRPGQEKDNDVEDLFSHWMQRYSHGDVAKGRYEWIPFRVEKIGSTADDSFSNATGGSTLASKMKETTDKVKEYQFLLNKDTKVFENATGSLQGATGDTISGVANFVQGFVEGTARVMVGGQASTVIQSGGNVLMPEVWKDSTSERGINLKFKLHAAYGNKLSYLEDIVFPLVMLATLAMPRQIDSAIYTSPPLVQCFAKGWFACDLGMVASMTIAKGDDKDGWSINHLPRAVEVTLSIKDLMPSTMMSMALRNKVGIMYEANSGLKQYVNMLSGVDVWEDYNKAAAFRRKFDSYMINLKEAFNPAVQSRNMLQSNLGIGNIVKWPAKIAQWFGA